MYTPFQSTIRPLSKTLTLGCTCALLISCNAKKNTDWFNFGKNPPKQNAPQHQTPKKQPLKNNPTHQPTPPTKQTLPEPNPIPNPEPEPEPESESTSNHASETPPQQPNTQEIVQLYRRLHVEMDQSARSQLIVELLNDPREPVCILGFDLASRDLSSGATLSADAANAAVSLLNNPLPSIRSAAARLITRLALPDAMTLITQALSTEQDPTVAQALLAGIERWPNPEARDDVLHWYQSTGQIRIAAANAAWGLADLNLWNPDTHTPILRSVYQSLTDADLTNADMRLIATTGTTNDINRLIALARNPNYPQQANAANALTHTPRGVDPLIDLAQNNPAFTSSAAQAIEKHRLNPNGIRQLAALPWTDSQNKINALTNACARLDQDQLADAIGLARANNSIDDNLSIALLTPLIASPELLTPRSAPGIVLLAELELNNQRPDRTIQILSLLINHPLDPASTLRATKAKTTAHILLKEYDQAATLDLTADTWLTALSMTNEKTTKRDIANQILTRSIKLTQDQQTHIQSLTQPQPPKESKKSQNPNSTPSPQTPQAP